MKINKQILKDFLKKVSMGGGSTIQEAVFDFTPTGIKVAAVDGREVIRVDGTLKADAVNGYEAIGKIGVQDIPTVVRLIDTFNKEVEIKVEGNSITFSEASRKIQTSLMDVQFIKPVKDINLPEMAENFTIESSTIKTFVKQSLINKDPILTIKTGEKKTLLLCDGKYKFTESIVTESTKGGHGASFGDPLYCVIENLTAKIDVGFQTNFPIRIMEKTDTTVFNYIVAPRNAADEEQAAQPTETPAVEEAAVEETVVEGVIEE